MKYFRRLVRFALLFCVSLTVVLGLGALATPQALQAQQITNEASAQFSDGTGGTNRATSNTTQFVRTGTAALRIIKTSDRQAAEPGDVVVYRLLVENVGNAPATDVVIQDDLPVGLQYVENSIQTSPLAATSVVAAGRSIQVTFASLAPNEPLTLAYGALLTPDAVRGSGRNTAQASASGLPPTSASFQLAIRPGILADCGTIIGRVFVDKNFDGEQQAGEPGVPNAVVFLDDGNRILTDPEGMFSVQNVVSGNRVGTLDLSSLPGYSLAPNLYRISDNSQSRLVRLSPGGLARMNFAVTPTFGEEQP